PTIRYHISIPHTDALPIYSAQQNITAELAVVLRWQDSRLAHTGKGIVRYPLEQIWHPRVGIVNETNSVSRKMPDSVEVDLDGTRSEEHTSELQSSCNMVCC